MIRSGLSFLLMLTAAAFAFQRARNPDNIGIDFVQFYFTGQHIIHRGDPHIYADDVRHEMAESEWQWAQNADLSSRYYRAVKFRSGGWQTYSSPFLYSVFRIRDNGGETARRVGHGGQRSRVNPFIRPPATFSPSLRGEGT